jgi:hypothetical protein
LGLIFYIKIELGAKYLLFTLKITVTISI